MSRHFFLSYFCAGLFLSLFSSTAHAEKAHLETVANTSPYVVACVLQGKKIEIQPFSNYQAALLERYAKIRKKLIKKNSDTMGHIVIPAISMMTPKYRDAALRGEPYFPDEALQITVQETSEKKVYALWQDETGIMCARQCGPGLVREECLPEMLYKLPLAPLGQRVSPKHAINELGKNRLFKLVINRCGTLELEPVQGE